MGHPSRQMEGGHAANGSPLQTNGGRSCSKWVTPPDKRREVRQQVGHPSRQTEGGQAANGSPLQTNGGWSTVPWPWRDGGHAQHRRIVVHLVCIPHSWKQDHKNFSGKVLQRQKLLITKLVKCGCLWTTRGCSMTLYLHKSMNYSLQGTHGHHHPHLCLRMSLW